MEWRWLSGACRNDQILHAPFYDPRYLPPARTYSNVELSASTMAASSS
jgi:hypothetical protein